MTTKTFSSAANRVNDKPVEFELDGHTYVFTPIKRTALVLSAFEGGADQLRSQLNWLSAGLSDEDSAMLTARLMDHHDTLEIPDLLRIIEWLLGEMAGRPTSPSSA